METTLVEIYITGSNSSDSSGLPSQFERRYRALLREISFKNPQSTVITTSELATQGYAYNSSQIRVTVSNLSISDLVRIKDIVLAA